MRRRSRNGTLAAHIHSSKWRAWLRYATLASLRCRLARAALVSATNEISISVPKMTVAETMTCSAAPPASHAARAVRRRGCAAGTAAA